MRGVFCFFNLRFASTYRRNVRDIKKGEIIQIPPFLFVCCGDSKSATVVLCQYPRIASMPGRILPSMASSSAPPPVET